MKKIVLMIAMLVSTSAFAQTSTPEFVDTLVDTINENLAVINKSRAQAGDTQYCQNLNQKQVNVLASYFQRKDGTWKNLNAVNAQSYIELAGAKLNCFPKPCKDYNDLVHGICNMKAYKMDRNLIRGALEEIKGGKVYVNTTMDEVAR
ncbi:hypothetical protein ACLVWU_05195 [Bdellovibrio sp. HCB290]|uniref:hypothetical protein n=1 Tax=Bdellovibrio sp. HCB290 TaxID=3394356 RepID=UPI0039B4C54F